MDRRKKIIIIVATLLLLVIVFLFFYFFYRKPAEVVNTNTNQSVVPPPSTGQVEVLPAPSEERKKNDSNYPLGLESLTSSYAERLASYSSDANFKNLKDLKIISTAKMQAYLSDFITSSQIGKNGFESQEAKALNNQIISVSEEQAVVLVSLQLSKILGEQSSVVTEYAKVELNVVKVNGEWIVDAVNWKS